MTQTNQTYIEEIKVKCANCMKETYVPTTHGTMVAIKKWVNEHKTRIGRTYCSIDFASIDFDSALQDAIKYGEEQTCKCGDANPKGNIALTYKGGCNEELKIIDAYRCTGCGGRFHKDCIVKHFELEKEHDWGRQQERKDLINMVDSIIYASEDKLIVRAQWENYRTELLAKLTTSPRLNRGSEEEG